MVFESRVGEIFVLGASSWRIDEITHDRVLVSPAPGQPGKMPFWKGDRAGRPLELGPGDRPVDARPVAHAARRRGRPPDQRPRCGPARSRASSPVPARSDRRDGRTARRLDHRDRARPRRSRRLANLRALAAGRPHPRAMGHGGRRRDSRPHGRRRRDAVGRRWVRRAVSGCGCAAGSARCLCPTPTRPGARRRSAWRHGALRREVPRERRQIAAAAKTTARHAGAALAAAQTCGGSAGGRSSVRVVPDTARDVPRVPA